MQSYLALRYFRMIGRCGRHDYLTAATAAATATHASHLRAQLPPPLPPPVFRALVVSLVRP